MDAAESGGSSEQLPTFAHHEGQVAEGEEASEGGGTFAPAPEHTPGTHLTGSLRGRGSEAVLVTELLCFVPVLGLFPYLSHLHFLDWEVCYSVSGNIGEI